MSEPVSNVEIEDVLASIRRLVSDENRPQLRSEPAKVPFKPSRLVLTPSLLVPVSTETARAPETESEAKPDFDLTDKPSLRTADAEKGQVVLHEVDDEPSESECYNLDADRESDLNPDHADELDAESGAVTEISDPERDDEPAGKAFQAPWMDPDSFLFDAASSADGSERRQDDETGEGTSADGVTQDEARESIDAQPAETSAEQAETPEADNSDLQDVALVVPLDESVENSTDILQLRAEQPSEDAVSEPPLKDVVEASAEDVNRDAGQEQLAAEETDAAPQKDASGRATTLGAKIAVLEAKIGQTDDQWEPDGEQGDDYAGTRVETIEWQDHASPDAEDASEGDSADDSVDDLVTETAAEQEAEPQQTASDADDALDVLDEGDAILDEESLRELVSDIVRQELQGALGERITRNVRKLVRREIHRALTAQDLE